MPNLTAELEKEFWTQLAEAAQLCYVTRAKELQQTAVARLGSLVAKTLSLKQRAIAERDEDAANMFLALENVANAVTNELNMWIALKEDDTDAAWTCLIDAQSAVSVAMQAHDVGHRTAEYSERLWVLEQALFPPQIFHSVGIKVLHSTCSICGREYDDCDHVKGRPYMGKMCVRVIERSELMEVSVVPDPANKHCRTLSVTDDLGIKRNFMTLRVESEDKSAERT